MYCCLCYDRFCVLLVLAYHDLLSHYAQALFFKRHASWFCYLHVGYGASCANSAFLHVECFWNTRPVSHDPLLHITASFYDGVI